MINLFNQNHFNTMKKAVPMFLMFVSLYSHAQRFYVQDTICLSDSAIIEYEGFAAQTYNWNFCAGNLAFDPASENFDCGGNLNNPGYIDFYTDKINGTYYSFVTNQEDNSITRNYYGSDPLSTPSSDKLSISGANLPNPIRGISIIMGGSNYYAFVVGGDAAASTLVRINFGNNLRSTSPSATNLGNIGNLDSPSDIKIEFVGGYYKGYVANQGSNTLSYLDFNSIYDPPSGSNIGNPDNRLNNPTGIFLDKESGTSKWFIFVANNDGNEIVRIDLGPVIFNLTPTTEILGGNDELNRPRDITLIDECDRTYGFITNSSNEIFRFELSDYTDNQPIFENLGTIGNLISPLGISDVVRFDNTFIAYIVNTGGNDITRLSFTGCNNAFPSSWNVDSEPPAIRFDQPGTYNFTLKIDDGLSSESGDCHNIVVMPNPTMALGNDTSIAKGASIILDPGSDYYAYRWRSNNLHDPVNSAEPSIEVDRTGTYTLTVTDKYGCSTTDAIDVIVDVGIPNFFTPNNDSYNDTWEIPLLYSEPEADVMVFDRFGNIVTQYKAGDGFWDGTANGRLLPQGTYWYVIKVPGTSKPYKGSITIKY